MRSAADPACPLTPSVAAIDSTLFQAEETILRFQSEVLEAVFAILGTARVAGLRASSLLPHLETRRIEDRTLTIRYCLREAESRVSQAQELVDSALRDAEVNLGWPRHHCPAGPPPATSSSKTGLSRKERGTQQRR